MSSWSRIVSRHHLQSLRRASFSLERIGRFFAEKACQVRAVITQNSFIALEEVFRHSGRIAAASHLEQNLPLPQDDDFGFADPVSSQFDVGTHRHAQSTIETSHRSSNERQCASAYMPTGTGGSRRHLKL